MFTIPKLVVSGIAFPTSYRNPPPRICQPPSDHGKADSAARACSTPKESVCALDAGKSYLGGTSQVISDYEPIYIIDVHA